MRKTVLLSVLLTAFVSGWAQVPDTLVPNLDSAFVPDSGRLLDSVPVTLPQSATLPVAAPDTSFLQPLPLPDTGSGMNIPFAIGVGVLIGLFLAAVAYTYFRSRNRKAPVAPTLLMQEPNSNTPQPEKPVATEPVEQAPPAPPVAPDTVVVAEPAAIPQSATPPPAVAAPEIAESPTVAVPEPEVFYMTVPGADGRFAAGARKSSPAGCLYKFVVAPEKPDEAAISFAGDATDMRNAQAFRDLELLPVCTFSGMPDTHTFRFTQTPGRAVFDGNSWEVKEKIAIAFG